MCACFLSFTQDDRPGLLEIIRAAYTPETIPIARAEGDVRPTNKVPILLPDAGGLRAEIMEWGFPGYPDKNKPESKPRPLINTKAETASILRTWAKPLREGRCVVPTNGFYEWQHGEGKRKQRYLFRLPGERALFLAGIHNGSGCFSILTAAANESMIPIHNRMPVILRRGELSAWTGEDYLTICDRTPPDLERLPA